MTPPDTRVLLVAAVIVAAVPVVLHEYRQHAHHRVRARVEIQDARGNWGAANATQAERMERGVMPEHRPERR